MHISRDGRGHLQLVNKPKRKGSHGRSKHTRPTSDHPTFPEIGRVPLPPSEGFFGPPHYPPAPDPPRDARPPARPPGPANTAHRDRPRPFDEKRCIPRDPRELYEEASRGISPDTGTAYPCTAKDLDASGGVHRFADSHRSRAELRAMWFSKPNTGSKVGIRQAALDIFQHNAPGRIPSAKEEDAIQRLRIMLDNACKGHWGPDVAIKCFCDLDTVFFRGDLRGHVCVTWRELASITWLGQTSFLDHGKALIKLNPSSLFLDRSKPAAHERPLTETLATLLHEMW